MNNESILCETSICSRQSSVSKQHHTDKVTGEIMIHLVYVSYASHKMSEEDLVALLEQSRSRNAKQAVTGMLLYVEGMFFQLLEGEEKDVKEIYEAVARDDRNKWNIVLLEEKIDERTFPDWSMGFKQLSGNDLSTMEGFSDFLASENHPDFFKGKSDAALNLLHQFKQNNT